MRAALVLLLCSALALAREERNAARTALAVTALGDAEPGRVARTDADERNASAVRAAGAEGSGNRTAAEGAPVSHRSSFVDVEELALFRSACLFAGKKDAAFFGAVLFGCVFMLLCAVVMWVSGGAQDPGGPKRPAVGQVPAAHMQGPPQQAYAPPPPSPGQLRAVPHSQGYTPGPIPQWWVSGPPAAPNPGGASPDAGGGAKDETVLFDTYEYRRSSRRSGNFFSG
jgi:hypothetical protein